MRRGLMEMSGSGSESSGSSVSSVKAWYEKGIYVAFTFDDDTNNADHHSPCYEHLILLKIALKL